MLFNLCCGQLRWQIGYQYVQFFFLFVGKVLASALFKLGDRVTSLFDQFFDDGKHLMAKVTAKQLLDEGPQKEYVNKLYLILISVAERTKDREGGLATAEQLSSWLKKENLAKTDTNRVETEEYMRHYSEKLHYEAETLKGKDVWAQAKKSYEIYLKTFPDETETPEVKFRFAVLLMNSLMFRGCLFLIPGGGSAPARSRSRPALESPRTTGSSM